MTPDVIDRFASELLEAGVGAPTVRKALAVLSGVFRAAVLWDRVDRNPVREVKSPAARRSQHVRPFPPSTVETLRRRLLREGRVLDAALVSVLAYARLRPEEVRALQWGDVGARTIRIERAAAGAGIKSTKTGALRTVGLLRPLASDLEFWRWACDDPSPAGLVFPTTRGTLRTDYDWRDWRRRVYAPAARALASNTAVRMTCATHSRHCSSAKDSL